jgi:hypothetical protein
MHFDTKSRRTQILVWLMWAFDRSCSGTHLWRSAHVLPGQHRRLDRHRRIRAGGSVGPPVDSHTGHRPLLYIVLSFGAGNGRYETLMEVGVDTACPDVGESKMSSLLYNLLVGDSKN